MFCNKSFDLTSETQLDTIFNREMFLSKSDLDTTSNRIENNNELLFLGNDVNHEMFGDYKMVIHGITVCGSKTTLVVTNFTPYVILKAKKSVVDVSSAKKYIKKFLCVTRGYSADPLDVILDTKSISLVQGREFIGFNEHAETFIRVEFNSLLDRVDFIKECAKQDVKTYSNEKGNYHRVIARDQELLLAGWMKIKNYKVSTLSNKYKSKYVFDIDISNIKSLTDEAAEVLCVEQGYPKSSIRYENMILASFDIEMIPDKPGSFPDARKNPRDSIFMIVITFHLAKKPESLISVCLSLKKTDPMDDLLMLNCNTERTLLLSFAKSMQLMQPDFITEFNGGGFDWPNVIEKIKILNELPQFLEYMSLKKLNIVKKDSQSVKRFHKIFKYAHQEQLVKVGGSGAPAKVRSLKLEGFINFDTLVISKQLEPNADSHKLNECLKRANLGSKDDLDINKMFNIYKYGTSEEMKLVAHYCFIDTFKLQSLILKKTVIQDKRELANLSYNSIYDAFNYANGSKIINILVHLGNKKGYFFDSLYKPEGTEEECKFPGAYVVPPKKGIVTPMLRLDEYMSDNSYTATDEQMLVYYSELESHFDSIFVDKNFDLSKSEYDEPLTKYIEYALQSETHYPISGLDYSSLYPSIIMAYNISPEKLVFEKQKADELASKGYDIHHTNFKYGGKDMLSWFVRHENNSENYGLCPLMLMELFNKRAEVKKILKPYSEQIFDLELEMKNNKDFDKHEEYNEACFNFKYYDSKQKALKVIMNTVYGQMGSPVSSICVLNVAGSVTCMGRYNLHLAKIFVEEQLKMKVYYGDTDSLYLSCNKINFIQYDQKYFTGKMTKLDYCTLLVEETFRQIEIAKSKVNEHLEKNNGTKFLKMAYEEVLYPVVFLSKKKYFGIPHEEKINFYPKKLFLRGLEVVKRGVSDILKEITNDILRTIVSIENTKNVLDIIQEATKRFFTTEWEIESFAKSAMYRTDKNNISVHSMVNRYRSENYKIIPEENVRFKYVICKKYPWSYDLKGNQSNRVSVGDCMELVERVKEESIVIDLEYYFNQELTGQLARLITFDPIFNEVEMVENPDLSEEDQKELYKAHELKLFNSAKKYITNLAKQYCNSYENKGKLFKSTYKEVSNLIKNKRMHLKNLTKTQMYAYKILNEIKLDNLSTYLISFVSNRYGLQNVKQEIITMIENDIKQYCIDNDLLGMFNDSIIDTHIERAVNEIRDIYGYETICQMNLPYEDVYDVLNAEELIQIIDDSKSMISHEHSTAILNIITQRIADSTSLDAMFESSKFITK